MPAQTTAPADLRFAKYAALACAMFGLMVNEYLLAVHTGSPGWIAWTYPAALDIYAYAAFRGGRKADVATALTMMALSQAAAHLPPPHDNAVLMIAPWAVVMPIVLWRVHHLSLSNPTVPTVVDVENDEPMESPETDSDSKDTTVIPLPQVTRWTRAEAEAAIRYWMGEGLTTDADIAPKMRITPQRVGQIRRGMRELVAA